MTALLVYLPENELVAIPCDKVTVTESTIVILEHNPYLDKGDPIPFDYSKRIYRFAGTTY